MLFLPCIKARIEARFGIDLVSSMEFGGDSEAELSVVNVVADLVRVRAIRVVAS